MPSAIASADLKAQGNALFGAKQFKEAGDKYTEAIQAGDEATDPKGMAVLYSNRAACRISLKRFMDAVGDALKATQLDPTYAKAHARLGSSLDALGNYNQSKKSWQQALDSLPHILSPAEKIQKVQYEAAVEAANSQLAVPVGVGLAPKDGRQPWDRAAAILPRLKLNVDKRIRSASSFSSAWVIYGAYEVYEFNMEASHVTNMLDDPQEFMTGSQIMNDLQLDPVTGQAVAGRLGAIRACCNGILRDSRIVNLMDFNFLEKYEEQLRLEMVLTGLASWPGAGPESIIQEALARQRNEGWKAVRPALTLNICSWIMKAILDGASRRRYDLAMEPCKCSLEVLRSLKETWRDVPKDDRGFIFEDSFLFGIQHIYIDVIMQAYASNPTPELLEKLDTESDCLIQEVDAALRLAHPLQEVMKGYYYKKKSELKPDEMKEFSRKAGLAYLKSGDSFPQDDEQRPWFLKIALENLLNSRSCQVRMVLEIMKRITESAPKAKEIWEYSHLGMDLWVDLEKVKEQEDGLRLKVAQGKITMNACIGSGDV